MDKETNKKNIYTIRPLTLDPALKVPSPFGEGIGVRLRVRGGVSVFPLFPHNFFYLHLQYIRLPGYLDYSNFFP
jgi:hypothetical protein